jgi:hypothetical protein
LQTLPNSGAVLGAVGIPGFTGMAADALAGRSSK